MALDCPFSAEQCALLAKAKCKISNNKWLCDDGNQYEFDEGQWRTDQIEILKNLLPTLPDHPSKASLQLEYDQIRMTGLWQDGDYVVSISRKNNNKLRVEAWWPESNGGDSSGIWFPFEASYQGANLDWGVGIYNSGLLEMDLRVAGPQDGGTLKMKVSESGAAHFDFYLENKYYSKLQKSFSLKRLNQGTLADKPTGFRKTWSEGGFSGRWDGKVDVKGCSSTSVTKDGAAQPYRIELLFKALHIEIAHYNLNNSAKPERELNQYWALIHYDLMKSENTKTLLNEFKMESRSTSRWGDSSMLYELSSDKKTLSFSLYSTVMGTRCSMKGIFKKIN